LYTSKSDENKKSSSDYLLKKKKMKADRAYEPSAIKSVLGTKTYNKVMGVVDKDEFERRAEEKRRFEVRKESNKLVSETRKDLLKAFEANDVKTVWELYPTVIKDHAANKKLLQNVKYSRWVWDQMIRVCAENGHVNKTFKLYNASKKIGLKPTRGTLFWLLQACAKAITPGNYVERCFIVLNEMKKFDVEANVHFYNLILQTCANEHDEENALKIFQRIRDEHLRPDQSTFSSMMLLYESDDQRQRDFDEEKMLLYWKFMTSVGLKPDIRACNTVLRVYRNSEKPLGAVEFYNNEIKPRKILPDLRTLDLLLSACVKAKDYTAAEVIIENEIERNKDLIEPDTVLYNTILRVYSHVNRAEMENYLAEMRKNRKMGGSTYALLITTYAKLGEPEKSFKLFDEMINNNFEIDARTVNGLVIACDMTGDTKRLKQVFDYMTERNIQPDAVLERTLSDVCRKMNKVTWLKEFMKGLESRASSSSKHTEEK
jgi:pentatricopeptide repeat protein